MLETKVFQRQRLVNALCAFVFLIFVINHVRHFIKNIAVRYKNIEKSINFSLWISYRNYLNIFLLKITIRER